jgi:serine/threonine protein phosphatase PrpC
MSLGVSNEATIPSDLLDSLRELVRGTAMPDAAVDDWAAATHVGTGRTDNQDAWGQRNGTFVVADGMGGRPGGATAATAGVAAALDRFGPDASLHPLQWSARMASVNEAVIAAGERAGHDRVGAAMAVLSCRPGSVVISHVGDVRIYRVRAGEVQLLTRDHTVGAEISSAGRDPASFRAARGKMAALTSFLGDRTAWRQHSLRVLDAQPGDRIVLCTDGVHRRFDHRTWSAPELVDCQALVDRLVSSSRDAGSTDDRTALAVRIGTRR